MVNGGLARTTTGLNLRAGVGTQHSAVATLVADCLVHLLDEPHNGWVEVALWGWVNDRDLTQVYAEPDTRSAVKAKRSLLKSAYMVDVRREGEWREVNILGFVAIRDQRKVFLVVEDGPA